MTPDASNIRIEAGDTFMLITTLAMTDLGARRQSMVDAIRGLFGARPTPADFTSTWPDLNEVNTSPADEPAASEPESQASAGDEDFRWRRHPQLRSDKAMTISYSERRARRMAVKGLYFAHNGEVDEAFVHFLQAVTEYDIDLTELPSFWKLTRRAILAAADAYEVVGRYRDAAAIQARVRTELRPRNVVPLRPVEDIASARRTVGGD
jgi:hypothetical protein